MMLWNGHYALRWDIVILGFFTLVNYMSYNSIMSSIRMGVGYEQQLDIMCVNCFVQCTVPWSSVFWYVYLVVRPLGWGQIL